MNAIRIRCPKCQWEPDGRPHWRCSCGHYWDTLRRWAYQLILLFFVLALLQEATGQTSKAGVVVDTTITGFHYATDFSGTSVYTQHGPSDINGSSQPTAFSVTFSRTVSFEQAKKEVLQLLRLSYQNGYKISDPIQKDTVVKGHPAYCTSYTETLEKDGYQNFVFNAVLKGDDAVLVFTSGDLDKGKFTEGFKKTFYKLDF